MDMLAPVSWSQGISGNSAVTHGGQEGAGTFGLGIALDFYQKYRFDLKYVGVLRRLREVPERSQLATGRGTCLGNGDADSLQRHHRDLVAIATSSR